MTERDCRSPKVDIKAWHPPTKDGEWVPVTLRNDDGDELHAFARKGWEGEPLKHLEVRIDGVTVIEGETT